MMKLLIINVTEYMPQNRVSDTIMHVTLKIMNVYPLNMGKEKVFFYFKFLC
jgi:hypothetical protein